MKIIAIGRSEYSIDNGDWTNGNDIPVLVDPSPYNTWSSWDAYQRALFFLDSVGNYVTHFSVTPWHYDGDIHSNDLVYSQISSMLDNVNIQSHPELIYLLDAYPNPFNPSTNITFSIPQSSHANISVYNVEGRFLETLSQLYYFPGKYILTWNADEYSSGIYFIKLDTDSHTQSYKLIIAK